jgi:hypothetical protein
MDKYRDSINGCPVLLEARFPKDAGTQACRIVVAHTNNPHSTDEYVCAYQNEGADEWYWGYYGRKDDVLETYLTRVNRDTKRLVGREIG